MEKHDLIGILSLMRCAGSSVSSGGNVQRSIKLKMDKRLDKWI